jgi:hypothetical protein
LHKLPGYLAGLAEANFRVEKSDNRCGMILSAPDPAQAYPARIGLAQFDKSSLPPEASMARCTRVAIVALIVIATPQTAQNPTFGQSPSSSAPVPNRSALVPTSFENSAAGNSATEAAIAPIPSSPAEPGIWELWIDRARDDRVWFRSDCLLFKVRDQKLPGVAGELSVLNVDPMRRLDNDLIHPVVGGPASSTDYGLQSGFRLEAGLWLERGGTFGVECGYFQLEPGHQRVNLRSSSDAALGPIFFDPSAGQEIIIMDSVPGLRNSEWSSTASDRLWSAEIQARWRTSCGFDVLAGYRHLQFNEDLDFAGSSSAIPGGRLPCG